MSDRGRVILIFATVGLIAGGAGFYFFKIHRPRQELANARAEIVEWETRFGEARACLLGKDPGSNKTSEALAIREMNPDPIDPWSKKKQTCTPLISKLARGMTADTGIPAIETAWEALDKAAQKTALAYARHVASSTTLEVDPLPEALDSLDAARASLRAAAGLPALEATGTPLPAAEIVQLADGTEPLERLTIESIPSAHGVAMYGQTASRIVQVSLFTGGAPKVDRVGPLSVRGLPDTSWGAAPGSREVRVGAFDVEGAQAGPTVIPSPPSYDDANNEAPPPIGGVGGTLDDGVVVFGGEHQLLVARTRAGAITTLTIVKGGKVAVAAADADGRVIAAWDGPDGRGFGRIYGPGGHEETAELPGAPSGVPCLSRDRGWVPSSGESFAFGGGKPLLRVPDASRLLGCSADGALFLAARRQYVACTDACRTVELPTGAPDDAVPVLAGGKLVAIAAHASVLGVWTEASPPRFYRLLERAQPVLRELRASALSNGKVIDVVARGATTFVIVRIPARA